MGLATLLHPIDSLFSQQEVLFGVKAPPCINAQFLCKSAAEQFARLSNSLIIGRGMQSRLQSQKQVSERSLVDRASSRHKEKILGGYRVVLSIRQPIFAFWKPRHELNPCLAYLNLASRGKIADPRLRASELGLQILW